MNISNNDGSMNYVVAPAFAHLTAFVEQLPQLFDEQQGTLLHSGRNTVRLFDVEGVELVAKRYRRANIVQRIAYTFFRPTKCRRAYEYALEFQQRGIGTPQPVAYLEQRRGGLFVVGYFVSLACHWPNLFEVLPRTGDYDDRMAQLLAHHLLKTHEAGILHGDLNLSNILYRRHETGEVDFSYIDTNRSQLRNGMPTREECMHNLVRLTHRRDLYERVVGLYAKARGWDEQAAINEATARLDHFEQKRRRHQQLKKLIKH